MPSYLGSTAPAKREERTQQAFPQCPRSRAGRTPSISVKFIIHWFELIIQKRSIKTRVSCGKKHPFLLSLSPIIVLSCPLIHTLTNALETSSSQLKVVANINTDASNSLSAVCRELDDWLVALHKLRQFFGDRLVTAKNQILSCLVNLDSSLVTEWRQPDNSRLDKS